jgi:hypothetical protein
VPPQNGINQTTSGTLDGTYTAGNYGAGGVLSGPQIDVTGGSFTGGTSGGDGIDVSGGQTTITAGSLTGVNALTVSGGVAKVYGGEFNATYGSDFYVNGGTLDLFGSFGQTAPITSGAGTLNGVFSNNPSDPQYTYDIGSSGGTIEFNAQTSPAPEASSFVTFALGSVLFFGGLVIKTLKSRKRTTA